MTSVSAGIGFTTPNPAKSRNDSSAITPLSWLAQVPDNFPKLAGEKMLASAATALLTYIRQAAILELGGAAYALSGIHRVFSRRPMVASAEPTLLGNTIDAASVVG